MYSEIVIHFLVNFEFHEEDEPFEFPGEIFAACNDLEAPKGPTAEQPKDATVSQSKKTTIYNSVTLISLKEGNGSLEASEDERLDELHPNLENIGKPYRYFLLVDFDFAQSR